MLQSILSVALIMLTSANLHAVDKKITVAKETKLVQTSKPKIEPSKEADSFKNYPAFTGKVLGNGVRLRLNADVESQIISELDMNDLLVVVGEKSDFYAVQAPSGMNVYIFRSFVLDNVVEGNKVNIRLNPDLNSPIVGYMASGDRVNGKISGKNHKWLEFSPPQNVHFFVAKEYIEKAGGPQMKQLRDEKMANLSTLIESANLLAQSEMLKSFDEIDFQGISKKFNEIISEYEEFPKSIATIKTTLGSLQEEYLKKKLFYLENKANMLSKNISQNGDTSILVSNGQTALTSKDRMKIWERVEEALYITWAASHHNKTMNDFYDQQKFKSKKISGIVESYNDVVMNRPGSHTIRGTDVPRAYLYSTMIDLHNYVGQHVTLEVAERSNNNFAFPAYYVINIE